MKVKVLHATSKSSFELKVNSAIEDLDAQGLEFVDIKYTTAALNDQRVHHTALILYK